MKCVILGCFRVVVLDEVFDDRRAELLEHVEKKISKSIPDRFSLFFDGWEFVSRYIVAVFASFAARNKQGFEKVV